MIYHVTARLREETACLFLEKLTDGSVSAQRPDGPEIVASMQRAVVLEDGCISWTETCFCMFPLSHERKTVLDWHFADIATAKVARHIELDGTPFMEHLRALCAAMKTA
ncbi:MAG: hypothetical protein AAFY99_05540 [Pseudomonadota bacterium]